MGASHMLPVKVLTNSQKFPVLWAWRDVQGVLVKHKGAMSTRRCCAAARRITDPSRSQRSLYCRAFVQQRDARGETSVGPDTAGDDAPPHKLKRPLSNRAEFDPKQWPMKSNLRVFTIPLQLVRKYSSILNSSF